MREKVHILDIEHLRKAAKKRLKPGRYRHSVCVQKQAIRLAKRYGVDWYKAGVAGLLHDICKSMSDEEQLNYLQRNDILVDMLTLRHPALWHAMAGSVYLEREMKINDAEILDAVRYHTTARLGMSALEQVVYLADVTSEDRNYPDVKETRKHAERSLDEGMRYVLTHTMRELTKKQQVVVKDTWEAYNYYLCRVKPVEVEDLEL